MKPFWIITLIIIGLIPVAWADPFAIESGYNYDRQLLEAYPNGTFKYLWISTPPKIIDYYDSQDKPVYKHYRLFNDTSIIHLETQEAGSIIFNIATCSYTFYDSGYIDESNNPKIKGISWTVKGKPATSSTWSNVNSVNNAACVATVQSDEDSVVIRGTKTNSVGTFQILLNFTSGHGIKETMRAYNNNPAWTNHNIGFTEKFEVPRVIHFGEQTYDLSNYNNTVLDKNWIGNNTGKLIRLTDKITYDFGIGFADLSDIKITWDGSKAFLSLNYLYPTSTVPYQEWFEVDPTFGYSSGQRYKATLAGATGVGCPSVGASITTAGTTAIYMDASGSAAPPACIAMANQFDITSIPDTSYIIDVDLRVDYDSSSSTTNCNFGALTGTQPSSLASNPSNSLQLFFDIRNGTKYISNNADCKTAPSLNNVYDLGSQADTDITNKLSANWFVVTFEYNGYTRSGAVQLISSDNADIELQVVYLTAQPTAPTALSCSGIPFGYSCSWTGSQNATDVSGYYLAASSNNSTWLAANRTLTGNVTTYNWNDPTLFHQAHTNYLRVNATASNLYNTTSSNVIQATTDTVPDAPSLTLQPLSETAVNATSVAGASDGGDTVDDFGLRCEVNAQGGWQTVVSNSTLPSNRKHTINSLGLAGGDNIVCQWRDGNDVGWSNWSANATATTFEGTTGSISLAMGVVGDVIQLNGTISITAGSPSPVNITQSRFYVDGVLEETRAETISINVPGSDTLDPFWYQFTNAANHIFAIKVTATNSTGTVTLSPVANVTTSREYPPDYFDSLTDPATLGVVNYTTTRFDSEDGVELKVNRDNVVVGETWPINCILQTNSEAAATKNQSQTWQGTWRNYSSTGYVNATWTGLTNTHGYITCVNPPNILFTTTSFTNSSLALFGIDIFDESYGSMLGVPVGIFFLAMAGSMANKRTAPTWIVVVLGMAGVMATIGFFTINPLVWGLALVSAIFGVIVNQKVF